MTLDAFVEVLRAHDCDPKQRGKETTFRCKAHGDKKASAAVTEGANGRLLVKCQAGCTAAAIVQAYGLDLKDLFPERERKTSNKWADLMARVVTTYPYTDETGVLLYEKVRLADPKDFLQRRPNGKGGFVWKLDGTRQVLYRLPAVLRVARSGGIVNVAAGEKDADAIMKALGESPNETATTNPEGEGPGKWKDEYSEMLRGASCVRIWRDRDDTGRAHVREVAASVRRVVERVEIVEARTGKDAADHLDAGHPLGDAVLVQEKPDHPSLADLIATVRRWQLMPDPGGLLAALGTWAANRQSGDPVWVLFVGPPGSGKTELVCILVGLPDVYPVGTMTEAALLSGTSKRDKAKDAKGGLLRVIGEFGVIVLKDFGSVLSMNRDARAGVLAALREIFDGSWTRVVGTDGGRVLSWSGKIGLLAGCTPIIDSHHAVMSTMGERFLLFRMPELDRDQIVRKALEHAGREQAMRRELSDAVRGFVEGLILPDTPPALTPEEEDRLVALASSVAIARAPVQRDGLKREIEMIPGAEAPTRIAITLKRLLDGIVAIGATREQAWEVVSKVAGDCIPAIRKKILENFVTAEKDGRRLTTRSVAMALDLPTSTARRSLEDLAVYGLLHREEGAACDEAKPGKPDFWSETEWWKKTRNVAFSPFPKCQEMCDEANKEPVPEMSGDVDNDQAKSPFSPSSIERKRTQTDISGTGFSPQLDEDIAELDRAVADAAAQDWARERGPRR